ncbi:unnamed protein product [Thelazia callipaeda]|uniref:Ovule protein n=1 Tax=Thelazia callipaeda TaxID=103827 RepID=A0A0N5DC64_THECL|nr:unnamed protein product [Thelazia callipaeda]
MGKIRNSKNTINNSFSISVTETHRVSRTIRKNRMKPSASFNVFQLLVPKEKIEVVVKDPSIEMNNNEGDGLDKLDDGLDAHDDELYVHESSYKNITAEKKDDTYFETIIISDDDDEIADYQTVGLGTDKNKESCTEKWSWNGYELNINKTICSHMVNEMNEGILDNSDYHNLKSQVELINGRNASGSHISVVEEKNSVGHQKQLSEKTQTKRVLPFDVSSSSTPKEDASSEMIELRDCGRMNNATVSTSKMFCKNLSKTEMDKVMGNVLMHIHFLR